LDNKAGRSEWRFDGGNSVFVRCGYNPVSKFIPGAFSPVAVGGTKVDPSPDFFGGQASTRKASRCFRLPTLDPSLSG
jgi:hypothetical protein